MNQSMPTDPRPLPQQVAALVQSQMPRDTIYLLPPDTRPRTLTEKQDGITPEEQALRPHRLLVVTHEINTDVNRVVANELAQQFLRDTHQALPLAVFAMTKWNFQERAGDPEHCAFMAGGQAMKENPDDYDLAHPASDQGIHLGRLPRNWEHTRQRLIFAQQHRRNMHLVLDQPPTQFMNTAIGLHAAEQAVRHALLGWLTLFNEPSQYYATLTAMWDRIDVLEDRSDLNRKPLLEKAGLATKLLLNYTKLELEEIDEDGKYFIPEPRKAVDGTPDNWLDHYRNLGQAIKANSQEPRSAVEIEETRYMVDGLVANVVALIHDRCHSTAADVLPD